MSLIFIFTDGFGLGREDKWNPLNTLEPESFTRLSGGQKMTDKAKPHRSKDHFFTSIDACLDIDGLPQSGTGQVTLFSGINTAEKLGRHFGPYPHSKIKYYLGEESIFQKFQRENGRCHFINAFPEIFFESAKKRNRWSCTTLMTQMAGLRLNSISEVLDEKAITPELTQSAWKSRLSLDVPEISEENAADRVVAAADEYELVLVEYYMTDMAGHSREFTLARDVLYRLDRFLLRIMEQITESGHTLLFTSDHGNIEDLSTRSHTRNNVPFISFGKGSNCFEPIRSIMDVTPLCIHWLRSTIGKFR